MSGDILLVSKTDGVAEITLNRPDRLNAIDHLLAGRLAETLADIDRDSSVRAVLLRGAGRAFMAGGDLKDFRDAGDQAPAAVERLIVPFHAVIRSIATLSRPVIAAVHGAVAGGGVALALACDFVLAADDAVFTPAYLKLGVNPDGGATWVVTRLLGERRALEWLMLGDPLSAAQAERLGLINRVVLRSALEGEARRLAQRAAAGPAQAQASLKRLIRRATSASLDAQLDAEADGFRALSATPDFREGLAAFFERREPRFD
ncbi:MAG TPA: enoyl-CoA hydratase [Caulobacteraceae bacterium]|jgi:2-(1,2-epoxy-1,2-dihydrophenyl)acetyl-CoA isomerase